MIRMTLPRRCAAYVFAALTLSGCCTTPTLKQPPGKADISAVVAQIQRAINRFWGPQPNNLPPLNNVVVSLQTVADNRINGEIDYLVVALKGYYDSALTQEVDLTLTPPPPGLSLSLAGTPNLAQSLSDAIAAAQSEIRATYVSGGHTLVTKEIDVQIKFAVTWDGSVGVNTWKIAPISLSASDEYSRSTTDTITVAFKAP